MASKFSHLALLGAAIALPLQAANAQSAQERSVLAPSGEWSLSNDGESCLIARQFGGRDGGVTFGLQAFAPGMPIYNVILRGDPLPHRASGTVDFDFRFGPDAESVSSKGVLTASETPRLNFRTSLEPASVIAARRNGEARPWTIDPAHQAAIDAFEISFSRGRPLLLQLEPMAEPMQRLRDCAAALPERWGLDPAVQRTLSRAALPIETGSWLGPGSYPWEYLRNGLSVQVYLRLMTDERGAATGCFVQFPRGESIAGTVACREIMKTAKFEPALDANGNPVASYYATSIFFDTPRNNGPLSGTSPTQGI